MFLWLVYLIRVHYLIISKPVIICLIIKKMIKKICFKIKILRKKIKKYNQPILYLITTNQL